MPPTTSPDLETEIKQIFDTNELEDLKRFLRQRHSLNSWNAALSYLFHIVQTAGVFTTTFAAGYDMKELVWVGVGLNLVASLINVFEKNNNAMAQKLMHDIQQIHDGHYTDEGQLVDTPVPAPAPPQPQPDASTPLLK